MQSAGLAEKRRFPVLQIPAGHSIMKRNIVRIMKLNRRPTMNSSEKKSLQITACKIRMDAIEGVYHAKSGHPGGSLSAADLYAYLYFKEMNVNPEKPQDPDRDRFVLSKGHCCPGLYGALA